LKQSLQNGDLWKLLVFFDKENYLISASTPGESDEVPAILDKKVMKNGL
jgi:hypothetical protein